MSSNHNQAAKLAEIGAQLKQRRQDKDISLTQVRATTLISERHLQAIEEGNLDLLPEPVYVQGFIRKYSNAIGLDGLADEFPVSTPAVSQSWTTSPAAELRPLHLYVLYVLVIAGAVSILATFLNPSSANKISDKETNLSKSAQLNPVNAAKPQPTSNIKATVYGPPAPKVTPSVPVNSPTNSIEVSTNLSSSSTEKGVQATASPWLDISNIVNQSHLAPSGFSFPKNKPVNIGLVMTGQSWIRIKVDGETKFEGVLYEGTRQTWSADKNIVVRAGNAAAVSVSYGSQSLRPLGSEGEVVQQLYDNNYKLSNRSLDTNNLQVNWLQNMFASN